MVYVIAKNDVGGAVLSVCSSVFSTTLAVILINKEPILSLHSMNHAYVALEILIWLHLQMPGGNIN